MATDPDPAAKRPRISIDVHPDLRRRLRLAAAKRDVTVRTYVLDSLEERLRQDIGDEDEDMTVLTGRELYEAIVESLAVLGDEDLMAQLRLAIGEAERGDLIPWEAVKDELGR